MNLSYEVKLDIKKDAWNWWDGCNSDSHGVDWKKRIKQKEVLDGIVGKSEKSAYDYLLPFLNDKYKNESAVIDDFKKYIEDEFDSKFYLGCKKIVEAMGRPLYRNDFTFFLTTFPRAPYDKDCGYVWQCVYWFDPMSVFLHELCHFQFIYYWRENEDSPVSKLPKDQFEFLKESLTIVLDEDFVPLIKEPDEGYDIHEAFRQELKKSWERDKDFDNLVSFGLKALPNHYKD